VAPRLYSGRTTQAFKYTVLAERHQCHSISTILKELVDDCYVVSQPTHIHSNTRDGKNSRILTIYGSRFRKLCLGRPPTRGLQTLPYCANYIYRSFRKKSLLSQRSVRMKVAITHRRRSYHTLLQSTQRMLAVTITD
jgi:hypothetical protein